MMYKIDDFCFEIKHSECEVEMKLKEKKMKF